MPEQAPPQALPGTETPNLNPEPVNGVPATEAHDISMTDAPAQIAAPPTQQPQHPTSTTPTTAPSPAAPIARIPTPVPTAAATVTQQQQPTSRAASAHPDPAPPATGFTMPTEAAPHGAPVRQYINSKITGVLLEGMKIVAREQPKDPLRVLGEFLLQRSRETEGKESGS